MRAFELPKMTFSNTKRTSLGTCRKIKSLLNRFGQQAKKSMTLLCRQDDNGVPSGFSFLIRKEVTYYVREAFFLIRLIWQPDTNKKEM